jgi:hypothetical protein
MDIFSKILQQHMEYLQQFFDNRIIGKGIWPNRSLDLTPLDLFYFGT